MSRKSPQGGARRPPREPPAKPAKTSAKSSAAKPSKKAARASATGTEHPAIRVEREEIRVQFLQRPHLEPLPDLGIVTGRSPGTASGAGGRRRLAFVLHAHLPWVLGHGTWPHGEDWLAEAVVHCYLPLLDAADRLAERGRRNLFAFEVTPILAAMLADPRTEEAVERYLTGRTRAAWEARRKHPLAIWWHGEFERLRAIWDRFDHNLVATLARLSDLGASSSRPPPGRTSICRSPNSSKLVRLALRTGKEQHRELFGDDPRGCWMPECAYRPGGPWQHPVTGAFEEGRPGNEQFLAEQGMRWTVLDAHLLRRGDPAFAYGANTPPEEIVEPSGPHPHPYWIRQSAVAAFLRDSRTAAQVWSRQGGYPGRRRLSSTSTNGSGPRACASGG